MSEDEDLLGIVTVKRRVAFSSGMVSCGDRVVARFSGTFYLPDPGAFQFNSDRLAASQGRSGGD